VHSNLKPGRFRALFGLVAAMFALSLLTAPTSSAAPADQTNQVYALKADHSAVLQWTGGSGWVQIGGPAGAIFAGTGPWGGLYATNPVNGDLFHYLGSPGDWEHIGGPGRTFAVCDQGLFGLSPNGSGVYQWKGLHSENWNHIGDAAAWIYCGNAGLLATNPSSGDVFHWLGNDVWTHIGGPAANFTAGYGFTSLGRDGSVNQWVGGESWSRIAGPASAIYSGPMGLAAAFSPSGDLYRWNSNSWAHLSGPAAAVTLGTNLIFKLGSDGTAYQWVGGDAWIRAGGPMATVVAT
jgi:hypothetical protein